MKRPASEERHRRHEGTILVRLLQFLLVIVLVAFAITLAIRHEPAPPVVAERPVEPAKETPATTEPSATPPAPAPGRATTEPTPVNIPAPRLAVAFRLDPRVTRSLYLGDRWVSPPTFHFAQPGNEYTVQAKLQRIDAHGERSDLTGSWSTPDRDMIAIERRDHGEVTLVVRRAGEGRLTVSADGESKVLRIHARRTADAMDVAIRQ